MNSEHKIPSDGRSSMGAQLLSVSAPGTQRRCAGFAVRKIPICATSQNAA